MQYFFKIKINTDNLKGTKYLYFKSRQYPTLLLHDSLHSPHSNSGLYLKFGYFAHHGYICINLCLRRMPHSPHPHSSPVWGPPPGSEETLQVSLQCWDILLIRSYRSDQISPSVVSDSLRPHESQHARPPCPSPTPGVHSVNQSSSL